MWLQQLASPLHSDDNNLGGIPLLHQQFLSSTKQSLHAQADRLVCVWTVHVNFSCCFFQSREMAELNWYYFCIRFLKDGFPPVRILFLPAMLLPVPASQVL